MHSRGWTRKKCFRTIDRTHPPELITTFCNGYKSCVDDLICIDEAAFYVGEHGRYGYSRRGRRLSVIGSRTPRQKKYTLILAISARRGVVHHHNCRKVDFISFINALPVEGHETLLMDNIAFHHSKETKLAISGRGFRRIFIPSYSPKFNAIEYAFVFLRQRYRSACPPRSTEGFDYRSCFQTMRALNSSMFIGPPNIASDRRFGEGAGRVGWCCRPPPSHTARLV